MKQLLKQWQMVILFLAIYLPGSWQSQCPCSNVTDCDAIDYKQKEVYGYLLKSEPSEWKVFDWTKITTLILVDFYDSKLMCLAHENKVRVLTRETFSLSQIDNTTFVNNWISEKQQFAKEHFLDGIDLFVEDEIAEHDSALRNKLTHFVEEVAQSFHKHNSNSVVIFSVPWSPYNEQKLGVDGKYYDFLSISKVVDQLLIMDFDQRSQTFEKDCMAGAHTSYFDTLGGLLAYQNLTIDMSKMVLGLPWYARNYQCAIYGINLECRIEQHPYRSAKCSSYVASIVPYNELTTFLDSQKATIFWNEHSASYMSVYVNKTYGMIHQVYYDQQYSLDIKYDIANQNKLRGIGIWTLNYLDKTMWKNLPSYRNKPI